MFNTIEEALQDLRDGKIIVVVDDENRENEGDVICAAEFATLENVNFMATHAKGLICMPMSDEYIKKLDLPQMVVNNTDNDNIRNLFQYYLDNSEYTLACSDANVLVGIDNDGLLRYMGLEVGGLGTNLYFTSVVVDTNNKEVRTNVDISNAKTFESLYTDLADYCAKYDTIEDALESISYDSQNALDTDTLDSINKDIESNSENQSSE